MNRVPDDQAGRDRFATELKRNFSVIAAAGTGKTTAITQRIVQIAKIDDQLLRCGQKPEWLPRLVVVTFTNRAADEMQQRTRQAIFEQSPSPDLLAAFNRAFFGTIHSFCVKLLAAHGYHLGLPPRLDVIDDDEELWNDFVQRTDVVGETLSPQTRKNFLRHVQLRDLMELGRRGKLPLAIEERDLECPAAINIDHVISYRGLGVRIESDKEALRKWKEQFDSDSDFLPVIQRTSGSEAFGERWEQTFRNFKEWLSCCALKVAAEIQAKYRWFRAQRGAVTFDDQIALALELTRNTDAISQIRRNDYVVILDEAQDTDPQQFEILLEITRPPDARGRWIDDPKQTPARSGHFCMVGDFQQSIYGDRADLKQYRRVHKALIKSGTGEQLKFSVTFRLDQKQIDFVNKCFRSILNNVDGQVDFIPLEPRPEKLPGQVVRLDITATNLDSKARDREKAKAEAIQLARWIKEIGVDKLRARSWEHVAILCPRKRWFAPVGDALREIGIDSQIQSETDVKGDSPAYAWFTALLTIMTQPHCGFEIVGVLREIFGISDYELAIFCDGYGDRFQIAKETGNGHVGSTLKLLGRIRTEIADKPLFTAAERIVDSTQLRARLEKLPREDFNGLNSQLDVLLQFAATAEAEGQTLEEFAELSRANFGAEREAGSPRSGAIQLMTCQKAKGLEWDAVIVPFFSRHIRTGEEDFPRLVVNPETQETIVAFSKGDLPGGAKGVLKKVRVQEMERLLYVALTRARHTLVLAADRELFGPVPADSLTKWFRSDPGRSNERHMEELPVQAVACDRTRARQSSSVHPEAKSRKIPELPKLVVSAAKSRAAEFFHQLHPSSFIAGNGDIERTGADVWKEAENEFRARTLPSAATRYGVWWHEFAQKIPWRLPPEEWQLAFEQTVLNSPDRARSKREWKLLSEYGSKHRELFGGNTFAEMPFFWRMDGRKCLEGIIDLVLSDPLEKKSFILDWKTNQIQRAEINKLRVYYRPQIAAYWKAVTEMTRQPVSAGIYSTATGQLVVYDEGELADEWEQLKTGTADQLATEMKREKGDETGESSGQLEFGGW